MQDAATLFAVNPEWLEGVSEQIYKIHYFYQDPTKCLNFIKTLKHSGNELAGYMIKANGKMTDKAIIVFTETIDGIHGRSIERIYICGGWKFDYWKSRAYITASASIALNNEIWLIGGQTTESKWLQKFATGYLLPDYEFSNGCFNWPVREQTALLRKIRIWSFCVLFLVK